MALRIRPLGQLFEAAGNHPYLVAVTTFLGLATGIVSLASYYLPSQNSDTQNSTDQIVAEEVRQLREDLQFCSQAGDKFSDFPGKFSRSSGDGVDRSYRSDPNISESRFVDLAWARFFEAQADAYQFIERCPTDPRRVNAQTRLLSTVIKMGNDVCMWEIDEVAFQRTAQGDVCIFEGIPNSAVRSMCIDPHGDLFVGATSDPHSDRRHQAYLRPLTLFEEGQWQCMRNNLPWQ